MRIVAIIQARMGATRLPGKSLVLLQDKTMLGHVICRLKEAKNLNEIAVVTTELPEDKKIVQEAEKYGVKAFATGKADVLDKYYKAAKKLKADAIVRITADCPLIDPETIDQCVQAHVEKKADYTNNNRTERTFPRGLDVEVISFRALEKAWQLGKKDYDREHVTIFIYHDKPGLFKIETIKAEGSLNRPELRLTVDTKEDLLLMQEIYKTLYEKDKIIDVRDAIKLLDTNPKLKKINATIKQKTAIEGKEY